MDPYYLLFSELFIRTLSNKWNILIELTKLNKVKLKFYHKLEIATLLLCPGWGPAVLYHETQAELIAKIFNMSVSEGREASTKHLDSGACPF